MQPHSILDGLSLVDATGRSILAATLFALVAGIVAHLYLRARYAVIERDLRLHADPSPQFSTAVLGRIAADAKDAARRSAEPNHQAVIEDAFYAELKPLLFAERYVRAATGLVLVLGLLGTFYGLTMSIGKLVHLLGDDTAAAGDVSQAVTHGLTDALSGMAVAFSNSLLGVGSAVVLTALGIASNVSDRRTALMVQIETYLDRWLPKSGASRAPAAGSVSEFSSSIVRLEGAVTRFESALTRFADSTNDLRDVQLVVSVKPRDGR